MTTFASCSTVLLIYFMGESVTERIERFIEGQAFLRSYDSAPRQPPASLLPSVSWTGDTQED
jgi:hypothetical protein